MSKNKLPNIEATPPKAEVQETSTPLQEVRISIDLTAYPYFSPAGYIAPHLNVSKRLTTRQAKALRAITEMHPNQTVAIQSMLDAIADAIELTTNVTF